MYENKAVGIASLILHLIIWCTLCPEKYGTSTISFHSLHALLHKLSKEKDYHWYPIKVRTVLVHHPVSFMYTPTTYRYVLQLKVLICEI